MIEKTTQKLLDALWNASNEDEGAYCSIVESLTALIEVSKRLAETKTAQLLGKND